MAPESGEKAEMVGSESTKKSRGYCWVLVLVLRLLALCATVSATLVMALNKQTKTVVVATIGTTPLSTTIVAKFQHTPAFVFFVIVNSMASFHNLLMVVAHLLGNKFDFKGLRLLLITLFDMATVGLVSSGTGAAVFMADLGKNGNSHARWNKICDTFGTYCDRGAGALIAAIIGIGLMMAINVLSIIALHKRSTYISVAP